MAELFSNASLVAPQAVPQNGQGVQRGGNVNGNVQALLRQVMSKNPTIAGASPSEVAAIQHAMQCYCENTIDRGPTSAPNVFGPPATPPSLIRSKLWHIPDQDWRINSVVTNVDAYLDPSVTADMFRRPGYETPSTPLIQQQTAAGGAQQWLVFPAAGNLLCPAVLLMFYQSQFANLGELVGNVTGTLLSGQPWDSLQFDLYPINAGRFLMLTLVPATYIGQQSYPGLLNITAGNPLTLNITAAPVGAQISLIALTSTHQEYQNVINRICGCPGNCATLPPAGGYSGQGPMY